MGELTARNEDIIRVSDLSFKYRSMETPLVTAHDNLHIPAESWPNWTWYALEFGIVLAVSMVIGWKVSDHILYDVAVVLGHGDALESWTGISIHSPAFKSISDDVEGKIVSFSNWIFYGIVGTVFCIWYIVIRGMILKKRILR